MNEYIKLEGLPEWFEWNPTTQEGRTLDREIGAKCGSTRMQKGVDPLPWHTSKRNHRPYITFKVDGKQINLFKHQLVWMAYHMRPIPEGYEIHHIDFDWTNNAVENLQMLSHEEHMKLHGLNEKAVVAVDEHNNIVHRFESTWEAARNGFGQGAVSKACRGVYYDCKSDPHYYRGYYWFFESEWLALQN